MDNSYIIDATIIAPHIKKTISVNKITGQIFSKVEIIYELERYEILKIIDKLEENKKETGFGALTHDFLTDTDCQGIVCYESHSSSHVMFKCDKCGEKIEWHWEEFCRYYDCR